MATTLFVRRTREQDRASACEGSRLDLPGFRDAAPRCRSRGAQPERTNHARRARLACAELAHAAPCLVHRRRLRRQQINCATGITTLALVCVPITAAPPITETVTWNDATSGTSTIRWSPHGRRHPVVYTGTVPAGRYVGDTAPQATSGISHVGSVARCLLGTPILPPQA